MYREMATTRNNLPTNYHRTLKLGIVFSFLGVAYTNFLVFGICFFAVGIGGLCYERWIRKQFPSNTVPEQPPNALGDIPPTMH